MIKGKKIGEGTYGKVYSATSYTTKEKFAVKRNLIEKPLDFAGSIRELDLLNKLQDHPHIVRIEYMSVGDPFIRAGLSPLRSAYKDDKIHFIFPLADKDLYNIIKDKKLGYSKAQEYITHILLAVEYIHIKGIIHRDIKPSNILDFKGTLQLCDFGLAKPYNNNGPHSPRVVTACYRAPELTLDNRFYGYKIDIWSVGCIMYELIADSSFVRSDRDNDTLILNKITTKLPERIPDDIFKKIVNRGNTRRNIRQKEIKRRYSWEKQIFGDTDPNNIDKQAFLDLIPHVLDFDPDTRWGATEILNHKFFDEQRSYINEIRRDFILEPEPMPKIKCINCNERSWAIEMSFAFFNDRNMYDWYTHRILFQAMDIFDRYLLYLNGKVSVISRQNNTRGLFLDKYRSRLAFLVCIYICIKYFVGSVYPVSFSSIAENNFRTEKALKIADELETKLIKEILGYYIYRPTIYDVATKKLNDHEVIDLLYILAELYYLDPSLTTTEVYAAYEIAISKRKYKRD